MPSVVRGAFGERPVRMRPWSGVGHGGGGGLQAVVICSGQDRGDIAGRSNEAEQSRTGGDKWVGKTLLMV